MNLISLENVKLVKLGPGLVSKNLWAYITVVVALVISIFAISDQRIRIGIPITVVVLCFFYHGFNFMLVRKNPELALLEGAQLVDWYRSSQVRPACAK